MTRIHNIGHIHNANFVQTQFSTSHPQKQHFLKSWKFTFLWKYSVCGLKFEISEYPIKPLYVTYSPYKYELKRIKTNEMRAKNFRLILFSVHCIQENIQLERNLKATRLHDCDTLHPQKYTRCVRMWQTNPGKKILWCKF